MTIYQTGNGDRVTWSGGDGVYGVYVAGRRLPGYVRGGGRAWGFTTVSWSSVTIRPYTTRWAATGAMIAAIRSRAEALE